MGRHQVVEQQQRHLEQRQFVHSAATLIPLASSTDAAQQQHDQLHGNGDREGEQRQNDERNARLREHGGEIGNRQRLPEQDAAIAALAVQRVETIKHTHDDTW